MNNEINDNNSSSSTAENDDANIKTEDEELLVDHDDPDDEANTATLLAAASADQISSELSTNADNNWANNYNDYYNVDLSSMEVNAENDRNLYSESYGFKSLLEEMSYGSVINDEINGVDFQMRSEIESLMRGPGEVKKEMDLMEMICQGKL